jgi:GT2 family glycosyltransferase
MAASSLAEGLRHHSNVVDVERAVIDALIVIPFHNRADLAISGLQKLVESGFPLAQIFIIDNGSAPKERDELAKHFPGLDIQSQENVGFGTAANQGIRRAMEAGHAFTFILNSDAIVTAETVKGLVDYLLREENARVAACAPSIVSQGKTDFAGAVMNPRDWSAAHVHDAEEARVQVREFGRKFYLTGCALMCRNSAMQEVGMFDESFFMYWEDCDLCLRLDAAGWRLAVVPDLVVDHVVGGSFGEATRGLRTYYSTRNRFLMWWRHGRGPIRLMRIVARLLPELTVPRPGLIGVEQLAVAQAVCHGLLNIGGQRRLIDTAKRHRIRALMLWATCALSNGVLGFFRYLKSLLGLTTRRFPSGITE